MKIQSVVSDVRQRLETAARPYQGAFKAYVDAQRKALTVVTRSSQSLANTEIGAAKNIFASARASFDRARNDGLLQLASKPRSYLPRSRPQLIEAYKVTIDLLMKTGNELNDVVSNGYRSVRGELAGQPALENSTNEATESDGPARKTAARRKTATASTAAKATVKKSTTARKKTAGAAKSADTKITSASKSPTSKAAATKKPATPRKRAATSKAATAATTTEASKTNDADSSAASKPTTGSDS
jgi:hypothetical protein